MSFIHVCDASPSPRSHDFTSFSCKASMTCRNADGQTALDVAVRSGCTDMVSLLAAQTGLDLLGKVGGAEVHLDVS